MIDVKFHIDFIHQTSQVNVPLQYYDHLNHQVLDLTPIKVSNLFRKLNYLFCSRFLVFFAHYFIRTMTFKIDHLKFLTYLLFVLLSYLILKEAILMKMVELIRNRHRINHPTIHWSLSTMIAFNSSC